MRLSYLMFLTSNTVLACLRQVSSDEKAVPIIEATEFFLLPMHLQEVAVAARLRKLSSRQSLAKLFVLDTFFDEYGFSLRLAVIDVGDSDPRQKSWFDMLGERLRFNNFE